MKYAVFQVNAVKQMRRLHAMQYIIIRMHCLHVMQYTRMHCIALQMFQAGSALVEPSPSNGDGWDARLPSASLSHVDARVLSEFTTRIDCHVEVRYVVCSYQYHRHPWNGLPFDMWMYAVVIISLAIDENGLPGSFMVAFHIYGPFIITILPTDWNGMPVFSFGFLLHSHHKYCHNYKDKHNHHHHHHHHDHKAKKSRT